MANLIWESPGQLSGFWLDRTSGEFKFDLPISHGKLQQITGLCPVDIVTDTTFW